MSPNLHRLLDILHNANTYSLHAPHTVTVASTYNVNTTAPILVKNISMEVDDSITQIPLRDMLNALTALADFELNETEISGDNMILLYLLSENQLLAFMSVVIFVIIVIGLISVTTDSNGKILALDWAVTDMGDGDPVTSHDALVAVLPLLPSTTNASNITINDVIRHFSLLGDSVTETAAGQSTSSTVTNTRSIGVFKSHLGDTTLVSLPTGPQSTCGLIEDYTSSTFFKKIVISSQIGSKLAQTDYAANMIEKKIEDDSDDPKYYKYEVLCRMVPSSETTGYAFTDGTTTELAQYTKRTSTSHKVNLI